MNRLALALAFLLCASVAHAQQPINVSQINGNTPPLALCDDPLQVLSVAISTAASGSTQLVALATDYTIFACGYNFIANGTVNVKFVYGTGANCATGPADITGAYPLTAQAGIAIPNTGSPQFAGLVSNAVCINLSGAIQVSGLLTCVKVDLP